MPTASLTRWAQPHEPLQAQPRESGPHSPTPLEEVHHLLRHPSGRASGLCHRRPAAPASPAACPAAAARARAPARTRIPWLKRECAGAHTLHGPETDVIIGRAEMRTPAPTPHALHICMHQGLVLDYRMSSPWVIQLTPFGTINNYVYTSNSQLSPVPNLLWLPHLHKTNHK